MSQPFYPCDYTDVKESARYVYAPRMVAYLEQRYTKDWLMDMINVQGDAAVRRWFRWRVELVDGLIDIFAVDDFLVKVFGRKVMLDDLPEDCFAFRTRRKKVGGRHVDPVFRQDCIDRVLAGEPARQVAADIGRSYDCVSKWTRAYKAQNQLRQAA